MKEMCLYCYGTGKISCLRCGGTGVGSGSGLLDKDCLKCNGSRLERCRICRGSGFTREPVSLEQRNERQVRVMPV